jgi:hypothetical protein
MRFFRRGDKPVKQGAMPKINAVTITGEGIVALVMRYAASMPIDSMQQRVQEYVSFAVDGPLVAQFPETAGKPVQILVAPDEAPTAELESYVDLVRPKLAAYGVAIEINRSGAASRSPAT